MFHLWIALKTDVLLADATKPACSGLFGTTLIAYICLVRAITDAHGVFRRSALW